MDIVNKNKKGWNYLVKSNSAYSNTSLPFYGPYVEGEDKLNIFESVCVGGGYTCFRIWVC